MLAYLVETAALVAGKLGTWGAAATYKKLCANPRVAIAVIGVPVAFGIFLAGDLHGYNAAIKKADQAATLAQLKIAQRDLAVQKQTAAEAAADRDRLQQLTTELQGKVQSYEDALSKHRTPTACGLTRSDVRRLRNFR